MRHATWILAAVLGVAGCDSGGGGGGGEDSGPGPDTRAPAWDTAGGEDTAPCYPQCADRLCGDDGCGGQCGDCPEGFTCGEDFTCVEEACVSDCTGKACGDDGCGAECGWCLGGTECVDGACVAPDMILVNDGTFWMGCYSDEDVQYNACAGDEYPYHEVFLHGFEIDRFEVTVSRYAQCMGAGACGTPEDSNAACNYGKGGRHEHPVNCVSWFQAEAFCAWDGKRLCTAAEWERAARGEDGRVWPWGNEVPDCDKAVMSIGAATCAATGTLPVGSVPAGASPHGVQDMAGNVAEWVADWYLEDWYYQSPANDPKGPINGSQRELRGGGFDATFPMLRTSLRDSVQPIAGYGNLGIRCCR